MGWVNPPIRWGWHAAAGVAAAGVDHQRQPGHPPAARETRHVGDTMERLVIVETFFWPPYLQELLPCPLPILNFGGGESKAQLSVTGGGRVMSNFNVLTCFFLEINFAE